MFKLDLEKAEEPEMELTTSAESLKKEKSSRKTSTSASLTKLKPFVRPPQITILPFCISFFLKMVFITTSFFFFDI